MSGITFLSGMTGVKIRKAHHFSFHDMEFKSQTHYGLHVPTLLGDSDACNHLQLDMVRFDNSGRWGFYGEVATGVNELSFVSMKNVTFEDCGTLTGAIGGGMYWRGQMLSMDSVAFVVCQNRGLYIEGSPGLGSDVYGSNVTFENNIGKGIQCYGISGMVFDNLQLYNNDTYVAKYGIWADGNSSVVRNILVRSAKVRATSGNNPYTAFQAHGANMSNCKAQNIAWDNFGYPGQTQMSGFTP